MTERLGLKERSELNAAEQEVYDQLVKFTDENFHGVFKARDDRGRFIGPFGIVIQTPEVAKAYLAMADAIAGIGGLDSEARETAILTVGASTAARYETYAHEPVSKFSREDLDTILAGKCPESFEGKRRTAYRVTKALLGRKGPLEKELWDESVKAFGRDGSISLVHYIGFYVYTATLLNGFDAGVPE